MWYSKLYIYIKRYGWYVLAILSFIIFYFILKNKGNKYKDQLSSLLKEKKDLTQIELNNLEKQSSETNMKLDKIKKIKNKDRRRDEISKLLKTVPIIIILFISCSTKDNSILPPRLDIPNLELSEVDIEKDFGRIPFSSALLTLEDGNTISINGGFAFDDHETMKFIKFAKENELYKRQIELLVDSYNHLHDFCTILEDDVNLFEKYECEICFASGVGSVIGILKTVDVVIKE